MTRHHPLLLGMLMLLSLAGCSSMQPDAPPTDALSWEHHRQQLHPLTHWQVSGKIGIKTRDKRNSANLNWSQQNDHYQIYMAGPLGQGAITIEGSRQQGVQLDISGEGRYQAESAEQLLHQHLGWSFPIEQIPYWVRGLPAPDSRHQKVLGPDNRLQQLRQSGWAISYLSYHNGPAPQLPRKIVLDRDDRLTLTLILKQWQLSQDG